MSTLTFLMATAVIAAAAVVVFDQIQRYRGKLAADARAREMLETWEERVREAKQLDEWGEADPRNRAPR